MQRSTFFLISSGITTLFAVSMIVAPDAAAQGHGFTPGPELALVFRAVGEPLLAMAILNLLVRNEPDSRALLSVLIMNVAYHAFALIDVGYSVVDGTLLASTVLPGVGAHLAIGIGSLIYALKVDAVEGSSTEGGSTWPAAATAEG